MNVARANKTKPIAIAALAFGAAFVGVFAVTFAPWTLAAITGSGPRCEDQATVETVKSLALKRLDGDSGIYLLGGNVAWGNKQLSVSSFRDRGKIGSGIKCAAIITVKADSLSREVSTEYSVEPTSDGKTMVTARFMPN
jgi:hypothetical protein